MSHRPPRALVAALGVIAVCLAALIARHFSRPKRPALPTVTLAGRRRAEGCLACHARTRGLGRAHDPRVVGCSACHGGDPRASTADAAHRGMDVLAGDLRTAANTCGQLGCHPVETARVLGSLMAGAPGILAVDRFAFGERDDPTPQPGDDLRTLAADAPARSPAEDHARRLCAGCHLGARKSARGDLGFGARGGGCAACHLAPPDTRDARPSDEDGALHPDVSAAVSPARCRGCHARSGRISLSFVGEVELEAGDARVVGRLPDGRPYGRAPADVHARAGMTCMDCHTERDVMGDGRAHGFATEAVGTTCDDCHAPRPHAPDADAEAVAARLRGQWARRGRTALPTDARAIVNGRGVPLWRTDAASATLWRADDGAPLRITQRTDAAYHTLAGHQRLTCQACHSAWSPRCGACHTTFDPSGNDIDALSDRPRPGAWREAAGANGMGPPVLLVHADRIAPFTEGMALTVDGLARTVTRTLWAPLDPHTTGAARACAACHPTGGLEGVFPAVGETTRPDARTLNAPERERVEAVGRCVRCHGRYDDGIYRDFPASERAAAARAGRAGDPHRGG